MNPSLSLFLSSFCSHFLFFSNLKERDVGKERKEGKDGWMKAREGEREEERKERERTGRKMN